MRKICLLAIASTLLLVADAGARQRVVVLPPAGQPTEVALAGGRIVWAEAVPGSTPRDRELPPIRVRIAGPGEQPRTLVTFPGVESSEPGGYQLAQIVASATDVAVARYAVGATPVSRTDVDYNVHVDELWAGPVDGPLSRIAACDPGRDYPALYVHFDVSAGRVVRETCAEGRELVVHDLASRTERTIVRGGAAGSQVSLAGRYLAWEESGESRQERTLVVHDLETATDARRIEQPRYDAGPRTGRVFYVQDDGKVLDPHYGHGVTGFQAIVYSLTGDDRLLRPMNVSRLANDRTLEVHTYGERTDITVNGIDGMRIPVARVLSDGIGQTDFDGEHVAWAETRCGATTLYVQRAGDPFSVSRSAFEGRCPRVALPRSAAVSRRGTLRLPLRCVAMRRCVGHLKLTLADGTRALSRRFNFERATRGTVVARLRAGGSTTAVATVYDPAGFILARRTLALRP